MVEHLPINVPMTLGYTAHSDAGPSTSTFNTQVITKVLVTTTYAMILAPGMSVAFALQYGYGVSTAAVTFESPNRLTSGPSWDSTARRLQATTSTKAQVKIFLENSDATGRVVEDLVAAASSALSMPLLELV